MEIATERLVLRDLTRDDLDPLFALQSDQRWLRHYRWEVRLREDTEELITRMIGWQQDEPRIKFQLGITLDGALIGTVGLRMDAPDATRGDIGYELDPEQWGKGYATEAAKAMTRYGFETLKLHRVWSWCYADNTPSAAVLRRVGMREEGRQRETEFFKGAWHDTLIFSVLEEEWHAQQSG